MRVLRVNRDLTIDELDMDPDDWMEDHEWDVADVDAAHHAWVHDGALFEPGLVVANIGDAPRTPLPAYVAGHSGEDLAPATMTVDELRLLIT